MTKSEPKEQEKTGPEEDDPKRRSIYERIWHIMRDVSYIQKETKKVNNQYRFVSHDAVTAKMREAFIRHRVIVIPSVEERNQDGNRTSCTMKVMFVSVDDPDDVIVSNFFGYGIDTQDKGPGKAMSYAFKYALLKTFMLETGDDPEKDSIEYQSSEENAKAVPSQIALIKKLAKLAKADLRKTVEYFDVDKIEDLTIGNARIIIKSLEEKVNEK